MMTINILLAILILSSYVVNGYFDVNQIKITKKKMTSDNYSCYIDSTYTIDKVTCQYNCYLTKVTGGYKIIGSDKLQMMNLIVQYGDRVVQIPMVLNCASGQSSKSVVTNVITECDHQSISVKSMPNNGYGLLVLYMNQKGFFRSIISDPDDQFSIRDLTENVEYQVCVAIFKKGDESSLYKCVKASTTDVTCRKKTLILNSGDEETGTCYGDCITRDNKYKGVRSAHQYGDVCTKWSDSLTYYYYYGQSNWCLMSPEFAWCPYKKLGFRICDIPKCEGYLDKASNCPETVYLSANSESIAGNWTNQGDNPTASHIGHLVLLHNQYGDCINYILSGPKKVDLGIRVRNFLITCVDGSYFEQLSYQYNFTDLECEKFYQVYLMTIDTVDSVSWVFKFKQRCLIEKPTTPTNIEISTINSTGITISWKSRYPVYEVLLMKESEKIFQENVTKTQITYGNLNQCTKYCATITAFNKLGASEPSIKVCNETLATIYGSVALDVIPNGYSTERTISWRNIGDNCFRTYNITVWSQAEENNCQTTYETNKTSYILKDLDPNILYKVQVEIVSKPQTQDDFINNPSNVRYFYTGKVVDLSNLVNSSDISVRKNGQFELLYELDPELTQSVLDYRLVIGALNRSNCYRKFRVINNRIYNSCAWKSFLMQQNEDNSLFKYAENCPKNYGSIAYENEKISVNFTLKKEISELSINLYGRTYYGWQVIISDHSSLKHKKSSSYFIGLIILVIFIVLFLFILFIILKKRKRSAKTDEKEDSDFDEDAIDTGSADDCLLTLEWRPKSHTIQLSKFHETMVPVFRRSLASEYKELKRNTKSTINQLGLTSLDGSSESVSKKNRFSNILPYDQTRIKIGSQDFPENYINANSVPFLHDADQIEYLASQGPNEESMQDFLQMIWEQNVNCIVMLTLLNEENKNKCQQYWPDNDNETTEFEGNFQILLEMSDENEIFIERKLVIINSKLENTRSIVQIQMHTWFDYSAPNLEYFDKLLFRFQQLMDQEISCPYLVHCSAGVGRTGTFITLDRLTRQIIKGCSEIDVYETVLQLRKSRNMMVQRQAQYVFIYEYLDHFVKKYLDNQV